MSKDDGTGNDAGSQTEDGDKTLELDRNPHPTSAEVVAFPTASPPAPASTPPSDHPVDDSPGVESVMQHILVCTECSHAGWWLLESGKVACMNCRNVHPDILYAGFDPLPQPPDSDPVA